MELIQPIQYGQVLLHDITTTQPRYGEMAIWWLGQSGYAIKTQSTLLYFDLYLSEHLTTKYAQSDKPHIRMTAAPLRGAEITNARYVFASHKHSDHLDPGTLPELFAASPEAKLILPEALMGYAVTLGLAPDRLIPTRGEEAFTVGGLTVHSLPSAHPELDYSEEHGYPFLGFVVKGDGVSWYHSGDTLVYHGLAEQLRHLAPDIVFLPINGTDDRRNALKVPPNMNMDEALVLAHTINAPLMIPHHYEMFTFNTADVNEFKRKAETVGQPYAALQAGARFIWNKV